MSGLTSTNGIANSGNVATGTLDVAGMSTTNGISNLGNIVTTTLGTSGSAAIGANLSVANVLTVASNVSLGGTSNVIASGPQAMVVDASSARLVSGANRVAVTANGVDISATGAKIALNGPDVSLLNSTGHGMVVSATQTVLSGGTSSTNLVLDDGGATFSNTLTGGAARVTGVADGAATFDAVNFGQLQVLSKRLSSGVATSTAMANMPALETGKNFAVSVGVGNFNGTSALAIGGNFRLSPNAVFKASVGMNGRRSSAFGAGASFSW